MSVSIRASPVRRGRCAAVTPEANQNESCGHHYEHWQATIAVKIKQAREHDVGSHRSPMEADHNVRESPSKGWVKDDHFGRSGEVNECMADGLVEVDLHETLTPKTS
ncbi:MAG: hypothetical protein L0Y42_10300 [Phycisphaerales bacterium]|nr:hypothetical protein [Phycisphaerales bacterium]